MKKQILLTNYWEVVMKATGIVRKIDDLGRVVIPKEIRKKLKIREGAPLEIYTNNNAEIVLKKYATMEDMLEVADKYVEVLAGITEQIVCITDKENVIAVAGTTKAEFLNREIHTDIQKVMESRAIFTSKETTLKIYMEDSNTPYSFQVIAPIICDADAVGTVILLSLDRNAKLDDTKIKLVKATAEYLGRTMES